FSFSGAKQFCRKQNFCFLEAEKRRYTGVYQGFEAKRNESFDLQNHFVLTDDKPLSICLPTISLDYIKGKVYNDI
ncbi:MAG: hypothetical protein IKF53_00835, partial [Clostridia bacterium]|nr:hypothetical protein [Clostridia bacterium]